MKTLNENQRKNLLEFTKGYKGEDGIAFQDFLNFLNEDKVVEIKSLEGCPNEIGGDINKLTLTSL